MFDFPFVQNLHSHFLASDDVMSHCSCEHVLGRLATQKDIIACCRKLLFNNPTLQLSSLVRTFNFPNCSNAESFAEAILPQHNRHIIHHNVGASLYYRQVFSLLITENVDQ